ncbi:MAG: hypothetical protein E7242_09150 [Lachnospiraceae bacterium]|nr:hypothetical protein [Lachnospiraceae bacterium]
MDIKRMKSFIRRMTAAFIVMIAGISIWNFGILKEMIGGLAANTDYIEAESATAASRFVVSGSRLLTLAAIVIIVAFALTLRRNKVGIKMKWIWISVIAIVVVALGAIMLNVAEDRIIKSIMSLIFELCSMGVMLTVMLHFYVQPSKRDKEEKTLKFVVPAFAAAVILDLLANFASIPAIVMTIISWALIVAAIISFVAFLSYKFKTIASKSSENI